MVSWLVPVLALGTVLGVGLFQQLRALQRSGVRRVVPGTWEKVGAGIPRPDIAVHDDLAAAVGYPDGEPSPSGQDPQDRRRRRSGHSDAATSGGLAAAGGLVDLWHVDLRVLEAVERWTHESVDNGLDLWRITRERGYQIDTAGFESNLRGHVAEQEVEAQLSSWASDSLWMPGASNNPGFDIRLGDRLANVKVGSNASTIREHLVEHPDIPVIVNEDMAGVPKDALHLDLSKPFDPDLLSEHGIFVADGLLLSDLQDAMADAFGPSLDSFATSDLLDVGDAAVPGLGTAVRVVRSCIREHGLLAVHGDSARMWKNIGTDAAFVGGGMAGGSIIGSGLGALIDIGTGGATAGFGTAVVGPAIFAALGGLFGSALAAEERMRPLTEARAATTEAIKSYGKTVDDAVARATRTWTDEIVPRAERQAADRAALVRATVEVHTTHARGELRRLERIIAAERQRLLAEAAQAVASAATSQPRRWLLMRRLRAWRSAGIAARTAEPGRMLDVIAAAPGGRDIVRSHLEGAVRRRAVVLAAAGVVASRVHQQIERERMALLRGLVTERDRLEEGVRRRVEPKLAAVRARSAEVRKELVATGARTQEWVDEHIPAPSHG